MDFRCPSCQKDLTVPDEYAGQQMKCPLCQNTFQAPALPPPVAPAAAPAAGPGTYPVATEPIPPAAPPPHQEVTPRKPEPPPAPPSPPPVPTGEYTRTRSTWISPRVVPWIAPVAVLVTLLLSFFSWAGYAGGDSFLPWGWGWGRAPQWNPLTFFYTLMLLFGFLASMAIAAFRLVPTLKAPAALHQVWPWRAGLVALFAFLGLFFLLVQLCIGFTPEADNLHTTFFAWLALFFQFVVLVGALLDFWLEVRGPSRPMPRIDISW
jgi:hypothetical protein